MCCFWLFVPYSQDFLDETGILPLLNDAGGGGDDAASIASAMGLLSDALTGEHNSGSGGGGGGGSDSGSGSHPLDEDKDSWERGVAVPSDPEEEAHSVEKGLRSAGVGGDAEEVDQVDVIMQVRYDAVKVGGGWILQFGLVVVRVENLLGFQCSTAVT